MIPGLDTVQTSAQGGDHYEICSFLVVGSLLFQRQRKFKSGSAGYFTPVSWFQCSETFLGMFNLLV